MGGTRCRSVVDSWILCLVTEGIWNIVLIMDIVGQILLWYGDYGAGITMLVLLVVALGGYSYRSITEKDTQIKKEDVEKHDRIEKLEAKVEKNYADLIAIKDTQAKTLIDMSNRYAEISIKMMDVIEDNTREIKNSNEIQAKLQSYLSFFMDKFGDKTFKSLKK